MSRIHSEVELSNADKVLQARFKTILENEKSIEWILKYWNRIELRLIRSFNKPEAEEVQDNTGKNDKKKDAKKVGFVLGQPEYKVEQYKYI